MEIICVDTNLLVDYFRKKDKAETRLYRLATLYAISVPSIVAYEFLRGQKNSSVDSFLDALLASTGSLPFDLACAQKAAEVWQLIRASGRSIEPEDLLIAATSLTWGYPLATLNPKHFDFIPEIRLL